MKKDVLWWFFHKECVLKSLIPSFLKNQREMPILVEYHVYCVGYKSSNPNNRRGTTLLFQQDAPKQKYYTSPTMTIVFLIFGFFFH